MNNLITQYPAVQIVTANKNLVDALLAMNTHNRSPKKTNIDRIFEDLEKNAFFLTASGIGVSDTGVLLDGQNRLMAIRKAGYPAVKFVLTTGLSMDSQRVVDRHARRNLADVLSLHMNITVSTHMVAAAKAINFHGALIGKSEKFRMSNAHRSDSETAEIIAEHGDLLLEVINASGMARAAVATALFVYALHDRARALEFCRDVAKGINLSEDHPAYRLRSAIQRMNKQGTATGRQELFKYAASAVMAHADGRVCKLLKESESWDAAPWKWKLPMAGLKG